LEAAMANETARHLRKTMTPQEVRLWVQLRDLKQDGFHFRRQAPIGPYIVDFAGKMHRLVIEVDGSQHGEAEGIARDKARDSCLATLGYHVLRFWNTDVDRNMEGVIETVVGALTGRAPIRIRNKAS
jgi:very-short-patch-repair endonuclease